MSVIIQLKGGTAAKWEETNYLLAEREMGIETDTHNYKIGDGITLWNDLGYSSFPQNAENGGNKITSFNAPTDIEYPSAKLVYDTIQNSEDLVMIENVINFKDKVYDEINYSGLAKKYLRKNITGGVNVLTQEMINDANTIYEIRYDFDLNGADVTIPEGCVLKFEGGKL